MNRSPMKTTAARPVAALLCALLLASCAPAQPVPPTPVAQQGPTALPASAGAMLAEARVVPARSAELRLPVGGVIAEVLVVEGEPVVAGQPLVRLDRSRGVAALALARADLEAARAAYERLRAGARPEELASVEAEVA